MLITHLELENFKSYTQTEVTFSPGTNAIIGANGAGKSSLLEAIGFALFNFKEHSLAHCLHEGSDSGSIAVRFVSSYDEREYEVERRFSSKTTTRYRVYDIELDRQVIADGSEDVQTWLHQHLDVEESMSLETLFENTVGVPQGALTASFQQAASARKAIFDPLLRVEEYRKASDNLRETTSYLSGEIGAARQAIAHMEGQLASLPTLRENRQALEGGIGALEHQGAALGHSLEQATGSLNLLDQAAERVQQIAARLERVKAQVDAHERLLSDAQHELSEARAASVLVANSLEGHRAYLQTERQLAELERKRATRDRLRAQHSQLATEAARIATRLDQLSAELADIAVSAQRLQELAPLVEQQHMLEVGLRQAENDVQRLATARRQEETLKAEVVQAQEELTRATKGLEQAIALEETLQHMRQTIDELTRAEQEARENQVAIRTEINQLREQSATLEEVDSARCPVCEAELTPEHRAELLARNAKQVAALQTRAAALAEQSAEYARQIAERQAGMEQGQRRLRAMPTEHQVQRYQQALDRRKLAWQNAKAEAARYQGAPAEAEQYQMALAQLGNPRREYERHEDRVRQQAAKEQEQRRQQARQQTLQEQMTALEAQLAAFEGLDEQVRATQGERERHQEAHNTYLAHIKAAEQQEARQRRVTTLQEEGQQLEAEQASLTRQYEQALADYDAQEHARVRGEVSRLQQELAANRAQLGARREQLEAVRREIAQLEQMQAERGRKRAELEDLEELEQTVRMVRDLLQQAGPQITKQLVHQISREASLLYGDIMGDHSGRLIWTEDYELSLDVQGRQRTFRQFSGGEQMSAALALRMALLKSTSAIDVAFFDEPTAHLDPTRRESLAEQIVQIKGFSQLFVISHDDTFERAVQNYIRVVKGENGSYWSRM
ncbi:MAG: SMC family ATPase [Chloroflexi bacterium]|jgi:exonuclease SbcC|nr:SMC family ATPase [Chloroflexota bacterium]